MKKVILNGIPDYQVKLFFYAASVLIMAILFFALLKVANIPLDGYTFGWLLIIGVTLYNLFSKS